MKKLISLVVIAFLLQPCSLYTRANLIKVSSELKSIGIFYFSDFKQIHGKLKSEDRENKIY